MEAIQRLIEIDYAAIFIEILAILAGIKAASGLIEWAIGKLGIETKWGRSKREEHELLIQTSQNLVALQEKQKDDVAQSIRHDELIKEELSGFVKDIRDSIEESQKQINQFAENRIHDRQQSFEIQRELTESIRIISDNGKERDKQIDALTLANKELLADKINQRYKRYIGLNGIPEDEVDEFTSLHTAYHMLGGNHHGDAKYNYVMEHLPVLPVETKLVQRDNSGIN